MKWEIIGVIVSIVALVVVLVAYLIIFSNKFVELGKDVKYFGERLKDTKDEVNGLSASVHTMNLNQISVVAFLSGKFEDYPLKLYQNKSPVTFTELGEEILNEIGGKEFIDNSAVSLLKIMEEHEFKSPLDVEDYAPLLLAGEVSKWDEFTAVKNHIYHKPKYKDIDLDLPVALRLIGLYLRDKYLEKHPELK